ncbi:MULTISPECIES: tetratricopeptide repeat protein [unclassified Flavobacterium]|uniref:tetratricopeptide repeat protein n=1 Tax=unclassified Flavobacterium TaxID=196869 RepID=UPI000EAC7C5E|nr:MULTISPECIES: hypothetical protein [unclassified Flavobacterium]RKS02601.1 hypothetical protein C8C84_2324 [Flavobacterium sp. 102]
MRTILKTLLVCIIITSCNLGKAQIKDLNSSLKEIESFQSENNYEKANEMLDSLITVYPNNAELYFRLAHSKTISKPNLFEIMNLLDKCLSKDSLHFKALYLKSQGLMFMGDFRGALNIQNKLIENYPNLFLLKLDRISTYLFCGDFKLAKSEAFKYIPLCEDLNEKERLYRVSMYSNYFLGNKEAMLENINEMNSLGLNTDYSAKLINKELIFEEFAKGKNVGNIPCSLSQLEYMFPIKK